MVTPAAGVVVLVPFPFSDLSRAKLRPTLVLAGAGRDDWILCQITSNPYGNSQAILLVDASFATGSLLYTIILVWKRPLKALCVGLAHIIPSILQGLFCLLGMSQIKLAIFYITRLDDCE